MRLRYVRPRAGQQFRIDISDARVVALEATVDSRVVAQLTCPDPPCHEVFLIPPATEGKVLSLHVAYVESGADATQVLQLAEEIRSHDSDETWQDNAWAKGR